MSEMQLIKERLIDSLYKQGQKAKYTEYELVLADSADNTYYYADIDYTSKTSSGWDVANHCSRMSSELLHSPRERVAEDEEWRNKLIGALRFWVKNDFTSSNWWWNQIGIMSPLESMAIVLNDYLSDDLKEGLEKIISRGSFKPHLVLGKTEIDSLNPEERVHPLDQTSGTNLVWGASVTVKHAIWTNDENLLHIAIDRLGKEIRYAIKKDGFGDGVFPDGGFCMHNMIWYSGGYGVPFTSSILPIVSLVDGTSFELPQDKIEILLTHVLDGQRVMQRNGYFDFGAVGRQYSRPGSTDGRKLLSTVKGFLDLKNVPRRAELEEFYKTIDTGVDNFEITKYYDSICLLVQKKKGVYMGIKCRTTGLCGAEHCNDEGVLSHNLNYGTVTCIMQTGREYYNISPFWDYSKIPGTTARAETDEELYQRKWWPEEKRPPCVASGKAEGDMGVITEHAVHDGISTRATFFVFDGAMVALGTDIQDENSEKGNLYTTVEQCIAKECMIDDNFVRCGNVYYKNLDENTKFSSSLERRNGSWSRNYLSGSTNVLSETILTVSIPVSESCSYAYLVYYENEPQVEILRNDKDCQAILIGGDKVIAAFHADTSFEANGKTVSGKAGEFLFI